MNPFRFLAKKRPAYHLIAEGQAGLFFLFGHSIDVTLEVLNVSHPIVFIGTTEGAYELDPGAAWLPIFFPCQTLNAIHATWRVKNSAEKANRLFFFCPYGRDDLRICEKIVQDCCRQKPLSIFGIKLFLEYEASNFALGLCSLVQLYCIRIPYDTPIICQVSTDDPVKWRSRDLFEIDNMPFECECGVSL